MGSGPGWALCADGHPASAACLAQRLQAPESQGRGCTGRAREWGQQEAGCAMQPVQRHWLQDSRWGREGPARRWREG